MTTTHLLCGDKEVHTIDWDKDIPIGSKVQFVAFTGFDAWEGSPEMEEIKTLTGEYLGRAAILYPEPHGHFEFNYGLQLIIIV